MMVSPRLCGLPKKLNASEHKVAMDQLPLEILVYIAELVNNFRTFISTIRPLHDYYYDPSNPRFAVTHHRIAMDRLCRWCTRHQPAGDVGDYYIDACKGADYDYNYDPKVVNRLSYAQGYVIVIEVDDTTS